jgi:hypothetical protein
MSIAVVVGTVVRKAAVATSSAVIVEIGHAIHRSEPVLQRLREGAVDLASNLATKLAISEGAQALARTAARRLPDVGAGRLARTLAVRPRWASGVALFTYDAVRDGLRLGRGDIDSAEFFVRSSANAASLAASSGGAVLGGALGGLLLPVAGAPLGAFAGSLLAGVGGDAAGRALAVQVTGDRRAARAKKAASRNSASRKTAARTSASRGAPRRRAPRAPSSRRQAP